MLLTNTINFYLIQRFCVFDFKNSHHRLITIDYLCGHLTDAWHCTFREVNHRITQGKVREKHHIFTSWIYKHNISRDRASWYIERVFLSLSLFLSPRLGVYVYILSGVYIFLPFSSFFYTSETPVGDWRATYFLDAIIEQQIHHCKYVWGVCESTPVLLFEKYVLNLRRC